MAVERNGTPQTGWSGWNQSNHQWSITVPAGTTALLCHFAGNWNTSPPVTDCSFNGDALELISGSYSWRPNAQQAWWLQDPSSGTHTLRFWFHTGVNFWRHVSHYVKGTWVADTEVIFDINAAATNKVSVTADSPADMIVIGCSNKDGTPGAVGDDCTSWFYHSSGHPLATGYIDAPSTTTASTGISSSSVRSIGYAVRGIPYVEQAVAGTLELIGDHWETAFFMPAEATVGTLVLTGDISDFKLNLTRFFDGTLALIGSSDPIAIWKRFFSGVVDLVSGGLTDYPTVSYDKVVTGLLALSGAFAKPLDIFKSIFAQVLLAIGLTSAEQPVKSQIVMGLVNSTDPSLGDLTDRVLNADVEIDVN